MIAGAGECACRRTWAHLSSQGGDNYANPRARTARRRTRKARASGPFSAEGEGFDPSVPRGAASGGCGHRALAENVADPTNVAAFLLFTLVAVLVSNLAARARLTAMASQGRARATERLYGFSRKLAACGTLDDVPGT